MRLARLGLVCLLVWSALGAASAFAQEEPRSLVLATTTSVRDSGLLQAVLPEFEAQTGIRVRTVAVGSGAALRMGAEGNADLLLTHAPQGEQALVASGAVLGRRPFLVNYYVIAGPPDDPAGVAQAGDAAQALARIAALPAPWISRGDDSGTHRREVALLEAAGLGHEDRWPGYASTGSGMGATLQVAGERRAYTLSDIGTFLAFRDRTGLVAMSEQDRAVSEQDRASSEQDRASSEQDRAVSEQDRGLRNEYSLLRVDPARFAPGSIRAEEAAALEAYLVSEPVLERIAGFGQERFGRPLFQPFRASP